MRESKQCHATLRINASEEAALMELLKFMYSNNLAVTTALAVLDVLMVADKFDVASCVRHCNRLLRNLPMTPESVLVYLDLPSTILMAEEFQSLTVATKQFYSVHYKDITKFEDEILSLPLAGVEAIIASDDLNVNSEDCECGLFDDLSFHCFSLLLATYEKEADYVVFDFELAARSKVGQEFVIVNKGKYECTDGKEVGYREINKESEIGKIMATYKGDDKNLKAKKAITIDKRSISGVAVSVPVTTVAKVETITRIFGTR
ncbi:hypothetical protein L1987_57157 [Smallanthus sonchifolius]|uniref:Uncharacterized protein n=1 Tax=Smallanthus sonchifolius TaxID=185202 RepID=A0ACB9DBS3_9ASTR|nr:hypothetical protein L1987_57157 [Smallanthus sonchifolius]